DGPVELMDPSRAAAVVRALAQEPVVTHRGCFDLVVLGLQVPPERFYDTRIRAVLRGAAAGDPDVASYGLEELAAPEGIHLVGKAKGKKGKALQTSFGGHTVDTISPEQREYAMQDVVATRAVFKAQGGLTRAPDEVRQGASSFEVFKMGRRGLYVDLERLGNLQ